ncbi:MAG: hypothetical protein NT039_03535 [Candidatus Berkelbacteria bacterium]|nr:hypothetical protein [Candidatus Berkelbacteria bacterium]
MKINAPAWESSATTVFTVLLSHAVHFFAPVIMVIGIIGMPIAVLVGIVDR